MSGTTIESVHIRGFRSLANVEVDDIPKAAVFIGANGSGKSNFIRFFEMMSWMLGPHRLAEFVEKQGGADDQLFGGSRVTKEIEAEIRMRTDQGRNDYQFTLAYVHPDRFTFREEKFRFNNKNFPTEAPWESLECPHGEAKIVEAAQGDETQNVNSKTANVIVNLLRECSVYQFHDTSDTSNFKKRWEMEDNNYLRAHGGNLAAILHRLEREDIKRFEWINKQIGRILPVFDRFEIEESYGKVLLRWKAKGIDKTFGAHLTSDGSLRFFALVTLLNLPTGMLPDILLLDEPELGLHPAAVSLVGGMIKSLAVDRQIIVATQSPLLVDAFDLEEIFVLELHDEQTKVHKLKPDDYQSWLDDSFTPGELWQKNLLGGRP